MQVAPDLAQRRRVVGDGGPGGRVPYGRGERGDGVRDLVVAGQPQFLGGGAALDAEHRDVVGGRGERPVHGDTALAAPHLVRRAVAVVHAEGELDADSAGAHAARQHPGGAQARTADHHHR